MEPVSALQLLCCRFQSLGEGERGVVPALLRPGRFCSGAPCAPPVGLGCAWGSAALLDPGQLLIVQPDEKLMMTFTVHRILLFVSAAQRAAGGIPKGAGASLQREKDTRTSVENPQKDTPVSVVILPPLVGFGAKP